MEVQTRSHNGAIRNFPSLSAAMKFAREPKETPEEIVWKVSFTIGTGERVRFVRETAEEEFVPTIVQDIMDEAENRIRALMHP